MPPQLPSRKLSRAWLSATDKDIIGWAWAMEQSKALAQIGDSGAWAERVSHDEIAAIMGCRRETVTKALGRFYNYSEPCPRCDGPQHSLKCLCKCHTTHPEWREDAVCTCAGRDGCPGGKPRRLCQSEKLKAIAANHPHWQARKFDASSSQERSPLFQPMHPSAELQPAETVKGRQVPDAVNENGRGASIHRKHVRGLFARGPGFRCANKYALACGDATRPGIGAGSNQVGWLAHTFGADLFSRQEQAGWLEPRHSLEGYRQSRGQWFSPYLPDAWDCECVLGQKKFDFQHVCPKCEGRGFIKGNPTPENGFAGSMPWRKRMVLHFLDDRGWDVELRQCKKCSTTFEGLCPKCSQRGDVLKKRGELNGRGSAGYTEKKIGMAMGLHESTINSYFKTYKRIGVMRTSPGDVYRKCQATKCAHLPLYVDKCPGCGSTGDPIKKRDPQLIIDLTSRTLDRELARGERARLDALVKWHRHWLDKKHQADLEQAVELAKKVLGEWECKEHLLASFWNEMRRRLAQSNLRANLVNVLFPLQRE